MNHKHTPMMGWASWNCFRTHISEEIIKAQAEALMKTGLAGCGYTFLNIDDGFFGGRSENGELQFHKERFPNGIKPIVDYAHFLRLRAGIYSDAGDNTCGHYFDSEGENGAGVGLYLHEKEDLEYYLCECGFDFIKVDWCGGERLGLDEKSQYTKIGNIIEEIRLRTGREIFYNVCRWKFPGEWVTAVADSWRIGADIAPNFQSILYQIDAAKPLSRYCSPTGQNDLDMLQVGNGMSDTEDAAHFAMWCMLSTPLMIGCDLTTIRPETLEILKNRELIAVNQDPACLQAVVAAEQRDKNGALLGEVWVKDLGEAHSSTKAVAFLNRSDSPLSMSLDFAEIGFTGNIREVRNLSLHKDEPCEGMLSVQLDPHEAVVYRVEGEVAFSQTPEREEKLLEKESTRITKEAAREIVDGGILADARSKEEYEAGHLDGAISLPHTEVYTLAPKLLPDKTIPVVLYCSTGKRSRQARDILKYLGYQKVYWFCDL